MTNIETEVIEQDIVQPGEEIAQEAPQPQLPAERRLFERAGEIQAEIGGLRLQSLAQVMDVAKLMSQAGPAVPQHCRGNTGVCFALCLQAMEWKMSPFQVANKSYVTNDRLNYESQLIHAVIEARAPLRERLRVRYEGTGDDMICIVSGWLRGESAPREHKSNTLAKTRPPFGEKKDREGNPIRKGSPLWDKKPEVQMFYDTSRDWCRIYCPDVLMGIYSPDEIDQYNVGEDAKDITEQADAAAALHERLAAAPKNGEGFREGVVEAGLADPRASVLPVDKDIAARRAASKAEGEGAATPTAAEAKKPKGGHRAADARVAERLAEVNKPKTTRKPKTEAPAPKEALKPKLSTPEDYMAHLKGWLAVHDDPDEIQARWANEFKLRKQCGCGGGDEGTAALRLKSARLKEIVG